MEMHLLGNYIKSTERLIIGFYVDEFELSNSFLGKTNICIGISKQCMPLFNPNKQNNDKVYTFHTKTKHIFLISS